MKLDPTVISPLLAGAYRLWTASMRFSVDGWEPLASRIRSGGKVVVALWHDEIFPLTHYGLQTRMLSIVSQSRDGEYLARTLRLLGADAVRGSSSRGGVKALLGACRRARREGWESVTITVDGPRGPRHVVKDGVFLLAKQLNAPIFPVRTILGPTKVFSRSWDRFQLPLPFTTCHAVFGAPKFMPEGKLDEAVLNESRAWLQKELDEGCLGSSSRKQPKEIQ